MSLFQINTAQTFTIPSNLAASTIIFLIDFLIHLVVHTILFILIVFANTIILLFTYFAYDIFMFSLDFFFRNQPSILFSSTEPV